MSAYNAGASTFSVQRTDQLAMQTARAAGVADEPTKVNAIKKAMDKGAESSATEDVFSAIVKWVPGEVIGTYAGTIAALESDKAAGGDSGALLAIFALLAFCLTTLGAVLAFRKVNTSGRKMPRYKRTEVFLRGILSVVGLLLWSYMIPGSVSQTSGVVQTYNAAVPLIVTLVAIVFGLVAEFVLLPSTVREVQKLFPFRRRTRGRIAH